MYQKNGFHFVVFALAVLWLGLVQFSFYLIQESQAQKMVHVVASQLRQELDFSDYSYLARSITDFQTGGSIRCARLDRMQPSTVQILDLRYMSENCNPFKFSLSGSEVIADLKSLNGDLYQFHFVQNHSDMFYYALWFVRLAGLIGIFLSAWIFHTRQKIEILKKESQEKIYNAIEETTNQVAHDLRSPLSALQIALGEMEYLAPERSELVRASIKSILNIASDVLVRARSDRFAKSNSTKKLESKISLQVLLEIIFKICERKKLTFEKNKISIRYPLMKDFSQSELTQGFIAFELDLERILENILSNACEVSSEIEVTVTIYKKLIDISVIDQGPGIPVEILQRIGEKGFSFNKSNGNGLGVYSAKQKLQEWGGRLQIHSSSGRGTIVSLEFIRTDS